MFEEYAREPHGLDAELGARLQHGVADPAVVLVRPPDLQTRRAGHAVAQRAHLGAADVQVPHVEELHLLDRPAGELLDDLPRVRALDLEPVVLAVHGGPYGRDGERSS